MKLASVQLLIEARIHGTMRRHLTAADDWVLEQVGPWVRITTPEGKVFLYPAQHAVLEFVEQVDESMLAELGSAPLVGIDRSLPVVPPNMPGDADFAISLHVITCPDCPPGSKQWTSEHALKVHRGKAHARGATP